MQIKNQKNTIKMDKTMSIEKKKKQVSSPTITNNNNNENFALAQSGTYVFTSKSFPKSCQLIRVGDLNPNIDFSLKREKFQSNSCSKLNLL